MTEKPWAYLSTLNDFWLLGMGTIHFYFGNSLHGTLRSCTQGSRTGWRSTLIVLWVTDIKHIWCPKVRVRSRRSLPSVRIELFEEQDECLKVLLTYTHTLSVSLPQNEAVLKPHYPLFRMKLPHFQGLKSGAKEKCQCEDLNEVTIKRELLIPGVTFLGESCQGEYSGLGDLLILSGWCLNQGWLSKTFGRSEDGIGQPVPHSMWVFLPSPMPALLPPWEGIPGLLFHSLWLLETFCYRISWRQECQNLTLWQGSLNVLRLFSLSQVFAATLPATWNLLYAPEATPYPSPGWSLLIFPCQIWLFLLEAFSEVPICWG